MAKVKPPSVSVIIPMYNSEDYIQECLESLLNQTLKNIEVILVDDCSKDNSVAVANKMVANFSKCGAVLSIIRLKQNIGRPGIIRNKALDFAKGKYIYFLDSDDFLDATALEDFFNVAEEYKAEVVHSEKCFSYRNIDGKMTDTLFSFQAGEFVESPTLETLDIGKRVNDFINKRFLWWGWNKLFLREFLTSNNILFPTIKVYEDLIFTFQCVVCAKNYIRVPFTNCHYRIHEDSLSNESHSTVSTSISLIEAINFLDNFMTGKKFFTENVNYRYAVIDFLAQIFLDSISKNLYLTKQLDPAEVYDFYCREVFSLDAKKNIPLTSYLFTTMNVYKLLVDQQSAEIVQLKKLLQDRK